MAGENISLSGNETSPTIRSETLKAIDKSLETWNRDSNILRIVHAALTTSATVCSFLVAAKINSFRAESIQWLSFGAAVSIGLLSAFDLGSKANRFRRAWRMLRTQKLRFEEGKITTDDLIKIYALAEEMVGDVKEEPK